jgi:hypothetical protein
VASDASKPEERQAAVRLGQAQLTAQARAKGLLAVEGPVRLVARRDSKLSSSYETRPSADVTLLQRVGGELGAANVFAAAAQIENLVGGQKPPEDASFRLGDGQLVVSDPEQFRPELLRAIYAHAEEGYPEEVIEGVLSHGSHLGLPRDTPLKKTLFACDELAGFIHACGLVRPEGIETLEPKSVKKKLKQPSFAAGVNRRDVYEGAEELGVELDEHIAFVIVAMRPIAGELGLPVP